MTNQNIVYSIVFINVLRVTKEVLGGDCNEGQKARPGQDVTMRIEVGTNQNTVFRSIDQLKQSIYLLYILIVDHRTILGKS